MTRHRSFIAAQFALLLCIAPNAFSSSPCEIQLTAKVRLPKAGDTVVVQRNGKQTPLLYLGSDETAYFLANPVDGGKIFYVNKDEADAGFDSVDSLTTEWQGDLFACQTYALVNCLDALNRKGVLKDAQTRKKLVSNRKSFLKELVKKAFQGEDPRETPYPDMDFVHEEVPRIFKKSGFQIQKIERARPKDLDALIRVLKKNGVAYAELNATFENIRIRDLATQEDLSWTRLEPEPAFFDSEGRDQHPMMVFTSVFPNHVAAVVDYFELGKTGEGVFTVLDSASGHASFWTKKAFIELMTPPEKDFRGPPVNFLLVQPRTR